MFFTLPLVFTLIALVFIVVNGFQVLREYERAVVFRFGRLLKDGAIVGGNGPGIIILIPGIDRMERVSLRTITMDVPSQDVITKDNVTVKVNAVLYFRVVEPQKAILVVENYLYATSQIAQTTLRSILGQSQLDELLAKREEINLALQRIIDQQTEPWGVKVSAVEMKNVDLPQEMLRAMAKQAEAERERRAKVIHAQGEFEAAQKLTEAAHIISTEPATMQLRFLQTLTEVATEKNSTIVFPVPIDIISSFLKK
jgi:regulator of protease activity HflC (stomatin/prohibitin superfamily)